MESTCSTVCWLQRSWKSPSSVTTLERKWLPTSGNREQICGSEFGAVLVSGEIKAEVDLRHNVTLRLDKD